MMQKHLLSVLFLIVSGMFFFLPAQSRANEFEVYFERYAATPNMDSTKTLDQIRDFAQAHPDMLLLIEGYSNADDVRKGVKVPGPVMEDLAYGRALFVVHWLKTSLGRETLQETIRSYPGKQPDTAQAGENLSSDAGRQVVVTFYTKDSPPPALASELASGKAPKILVEESVYTFSGIYEGETLEHDFVVKNTGTDTLDIKSVKPG